MVQLLRWLSLLFFFCLMLGCGKAAYDQGLESSISKYRSVAVAPESDEDVDDSSSSDPQDSSDEDDEDDEDEDDEELMDEDELEDDFEDEEEYEEELE